MHTDVVHAKAFGQMRPNGLNTLSDTLTKPEQWLGYGCSHILSHWRDNGNTMSFRQERVSKGINKAFIRSSDAFKAFQERVQRVNIVWTCCQQRVVCDHPNARDAQTQFEAIVVQIFCRAIAKVGFLFKTMVAYGSGNDANR